MVIENEDVLSRIFVLSKMVQEVPEEAEYIGKLDSRSCYIMLYEYKDGYIHYAEMNDIED